MQLTSKELEKKEEILQQELKNIAIEKNHIKDTITAIATTKDTELEKIFKINLPSIR